MLTARKGLSMMACVGLVAFLGSCGTPSSQAEWSGGGDTTRFANSTQERIMTLLKKEDMDDSQIRMLEHALANDGKVPAADYLTAWDNYRQCMVGKGYTAPTMHNINGIYIHQTKMDASNLSEAQQEKISRDNNDCKSTYMLAVDDVYRINVANPEMYRDPDVALVDCLRRHNLVPKSYTVRQYKAEWDKFVDTDVSDTRSEREAYALRRREFGFDFNNPQVRTCVVTNDSNLLLDELEEWKPFG